MSDTQYLHIENERIPYRYVKTKNRSLALRFPNDKPILNVEIPKSCPQEFAESFIRKKQGWILKQFRYIQKLEEQKSLFWDKIQKGNLAFMGKEFQLIFLEGNKNRVQIEGETIFIRIKKTDGKIPIKNILYPALRALAGNYLKKRTYQLADYTQSIINTVRVKDHSSKWGSCSSLKNINLNWHLIFLPQTLIDYVIIHELMHLREMNHSPAFWNWVGRFYPNYKESRKQMKSYQWMIGIFDEEEK